MAFVAVLLWFVGSALAQFLVTDFVAQMLPSFISAPRDVVLLKGVLLLIGVAGFAWRRTRRASGWLLALLTFAVVAGDLLQLMQGTATAPRELLVLRIPLHLGIIGLTLWSTHLRPDTDARWSRWR